MFHTPHKARTAQPSLIAPSHLPFSVRHALSPLDRISCRTHRATTRDQRRPCLPSREERLQGPSRPRGRHAQRISTRRNRCAGHEAENSRCTGRDRRLPRAGSQTRPQPRRQAGNEITKRPLARPSSGLSARQTATREEDLTGRATGTSCFGTSDYLPPGPRGCTEPSPCYTAGAPTVWKYPTRTAKGRDAARTFGAGGGRSERKDAG